MRSEVLKRIMTLWLTVMVLLMPGCIKRPKGVLSEKETIDLLTDMQLAEAYLNNKGPSIPDSVRKAIGEGVLLKHGVTREQLDKTLAYYGENADEYATLFDKVDKRIEARRKKLSGQMPTENISENDIWPFSPFTLFSRNQSTDGLVFSLTGDALQPGDRLEWKMRLNNIQQADALLGVEYVDGSSTYIKRNIGGSKQINITLQSDTGKIIKRIFGYFNVGRFSLPLWADSISLNRTPYDSTNYSKVNGQTPYYGPRSRPKRVVADTISTDTVPAP